MWTTGISTGIGYRHPIEQTIDPIREAGFETVEISTAPQHLDLSDERGLLTLGQRFQEAGLRVHSLHAPFGHDVNIRAPKLPRAGPLGRLQRAAGARHPRGPLRDPPRG
jgi:sugar phosphate isomerase/epimerase